MILLLLSTACDPDSNKNLAKEEVAEGPESGRYTVTAAAQFVGDAHWKIPPPTPSLRRAGPWIYAGRS